MFQTSLTQTADKNSHAPYREQIIFAGHSKKYPHLPLTLNGLGIRHLQEHVDRPIGINAWQWVQCISGEGELLLNNKSYAVKPGDGILLPADYPHIYYSTQDPWYVNFLCFDGALVDSLMELLDCTGPGVYHLSEPGKILALEDDICEIYLTNPMDCAFEISKLLYNLLIDLVVNMKLSRSGQTKPQDEKIHLAICFMQEHFTEPIGLTDIATHVGLSREYLCQVFKKTTNSTLLEYLTQIRVAEAKMALLKFPDKTVGEIARMCGFDSPSYFCSVFKKHEHMTPLEFCQGRR